MKGTITIPETLKHGVCNHRCYFYPGVGKATCPFWSEPQFPGPDCPGPGATVRIAVPPPKPRKGSRKS